MRLENKVAIVTGGADGIGLACAERFVTDGAKVVIADINDEKGQREAGRLGEAHYVHCDVSQRADVEAMVNLAVETYGRLDICVSNAGTIHAADFLEIEESDFDRVIAINLKGVFLTGQAAARRMVKQGEGGAIVNMSSINAEVAIPNQVPYVTSKGGVRQLTRVMALSLAPHDIRVNAVGPGSILTEILKTVMTDKAAREKILARTPLGRLGDPAEIASVVAFLASEDSAYITGQSIYPDGGRLSLNYTVPIPD